MTLKEFYKIINIYLQRGILKTTVDVPRDLSGIIPDEIFSKARFYNLDSLTFGIIHSVFDNIFGTVSLFINFKILFYF